MLRSSCLTRTTACLNAFGFVFLLSASVAPMFVISSLRGEADILTTHLSVNLNIGHGLFERNVCHGPSRPDEAILQSFGLSCHEEFQLQGCHRPSSEQSLKQQKHCDDFEFMQGMEVVALMAVFAASVLGGLFQRGLGKNNRKWVWGMGSGMATFVAMVCASAVVFRLQTSDLVNSDDFTDKVCIQVLELDLCRGYGISFFLQTMAVFLLGMALLGNVALVLVSRLHPEEEGGLVTNYREPLIAVPSSDGRYVIARSVSVARSTPVRQLAPTMTIIQPPPPLPAVVDVA
ncbi:hypothetical protein BASA81_002673 [Batrachochytrium salamandrivorans]|nr:hypothetical protein BASA81_002673 [Batrachochytrium salamandrivorans]